MVEYHSLFNKLEGLSDLETAVVLCIVAGEHCIIDTESSSLDDLENELRLVAEDVLGLRYAVINCSQDISPEKFNSSIISQDPGHDQYTPPLWSKDAGWAQSSQRMRNFSSTRNNPMSDLRTHIDSSEIPNIVIAKDLDKASEEVQWQALALIRSRNNPFDRAGYNSPNVFVFIPLISSDGRPLSTTLNKNLKERIFISHYHDPKEGYPNLEDDSAWMADDRSSVSSVSRKLYPPPGAATRSPLIQHEDISALRQLVDDIIISPDINCYMHNIAAFLRLNRAVASGISSAATRHLQLLARCLAPFQRMDYVCPSVVAAAARKVYRHRIVLSPPEKDRSLLYGSSLKAVEILLSKATPENIVEHVLSEIEVPL